MDTKREVLQANLSEWLAMEPYSEERRKFTERLAQTLKIHPRSVGRATQREQVRRIRTRRITTRVYG